MKTEFSPLDLALSLWLLLMFGIFFAFAGVLLGF